jgi:hypothetical protein
MPGITTTLATLESQMPNGTTQSKRPALDEAKYGPRTLRKDVRMFVKKMDWTEAYLLLKHCLEMVSGGEGCFSFRLHRLTSLARHPISVSSRTC